MLTQVADAQRALLHYQIVVNEAKSVRKLRSTCSIKSNNVTTVDVSTFLTVPIYIV